MKRRYRYKTVSELPKSDAGFVVFLKKEAPVIDLRKAKCGCYYFGCGRLHNGLNYAVVATVIVKVYAKKSKELAIVRMHAGGTKEAKNILLDDPRVCDLLLWPATDEEVITLRQAAKKAVMDKARQQVKEIEGF